jgi:hypothetical protein
MQKAIFQQQGKYLVERKLNNSLKTFFAQIEQLRRLRNQSPGLPILKTVVEPPMEMEISGDNESERPFKASNR